MQHGSVQRLVMNYLNQRDNRDGWHETRAVANAAYETDRATQEQMHRTRQALRKLLRDGFVEQRGFDPFMWRTTKVHMQPPAASRL